jgi:PAS domain S-box-containing protein
VLALVMVPTVSLLLLAGLSAWRTAAEQEAHVIQQRVTLADSVAHATAASVIGHANTVRALALTEPISDPARHAGLEDFLRRVSAANPDWEGLGLYLDDGWNIASTMAPPHATNQVERGYFQQALTTGQPVVSDAMLARRTGQPVVAIAAPVQFSGGRRGVLVAFLAAAKVSTSLRALYGGEGFEIIVVDRRGQALVHPRLAAAQSLQPLVDRQEVAAVLAGRSGSLRTRGSDGVEQLIAYAPLHDIGWGVLIGQPVAMAFSSARRQLILELILLGLTAALTGGFAWFLAGRLARLYELQRGAIAQAQAAAEQLSRQLAFTSAITRHLGEGVYSVDRAGRLTFMNPAAEQMLGWSEAELLGKTMHDVIHCGRGDEHHGEGCPILEVARRGVMVQAPDEVFTRRDGRQLQVAYTSSPVIVGGVTVGAVVAFHDISARKETEAALLGAARLREEFLAMVSHELRTPLTAVLGYADILLRQRHGALNERQQRHAAGIREAAHRQLALVNDLLDVSKLEAGRVEVRLGAVDPRAAVARAVGAMHVLATQKGVVLRVETEEAVPPVLADEDRLHQILVNLLSNAIKFTPRNERVTISTSLSTAELPPPSQLGRAWLPPSSEAAGHAAAAAPAASGSGTWPPMQGGPGASVGPAQAYVEFRVRDTGVGIVAEHLAHVWDRFYQADSSSTRRFGGTGLGLTIVKRLAELHGGYVWADSAGVGQGSTFSVWLPVVPTPASTVNGGRGAEETRLAPLGVPGPESPVAS